MSVRTPRRLVGNPAFNQRVVADLVVLFLPVPPSTNAMWSPRKGGGQRLSDSYSAWLSEAGWHLEQQRPGCIRGDYDLTLRIPFVSHRDLGNYEKPLSDLLEKHGVIRNDKFASRIVLEWQRERPEAVVRVTPFAPLAPEPRA